MTFAILHPPTPAGKKLVCLCNIWLDADNPSPLSVAMPQGSNMHDVIAANVYRLFDPDDLLSFRRSNRPSASQSVASSSACFSSAG